MRGSNLRKPQFRFQTMYEKNRKTSIFKVKFVLNFRSTTINK